jgi:aldehyde dehydrogenase (NAD+)
MEHVESRSPQRPDDVVVSVAAAGPAEVGAAVERARAAAATWSAETAAVRAGRLLAAATAVEEAAPGLADLAVRETGKPVTEARGEVARGVAILRYYAQQAYEPLGETLPSPDGRSLLQTVRRPLGVAGLVTPWNFPVAIPIWKAAPALAFGNTVVTKPSPEATACALRLGEVLDQVLPADVWQVVPGGREAGEALIGLADVVSFTGSTAVGRQVAAAGAARGIPVQAEMGGQNASIVCDDADVERAATIIAAAAMGCAGQKCTATSRVIVVGDPAPLLDALAAAVERLTVGDPADEGTVVGPVISQAARDRVTGAVERAVAAGGRVVVGGRPIDRDGWFTMPTVVDGVSPGDSLACDEVFGPVCAVLAVRDLDEAIAVSNGVDYGLVTSVFTADLERALLAVARLDTGLVRVNASTVGLEFYAPFGGEKASSFGPREQGKAARDLYTSSRTVTIAPTP